MWSLRLVGLTAAVTLTMQITAMPGNAATSYSATALSHCPAYWTGTSLPVPPAPTAISGRIQSVAVLSPSDIWMLVLTGSPYVYHFNGTIWQGPTSPGGGASFIAKSLVASSDSNVWVVGVSDAGTPLAWNYNGQSWINQSPSLSAYAGLTAAAIASNGTLYVAGSRNNVSGNAGLIWSYSGGQWTNITPSNPAQSYNALAVSEDGTLIAGGNSGALQEMSGDAWTTISIPPDVGISDITSTSSGTVYAVGGDTSGPILIQQEPGSASATVRSVPAPFHADVYEMGVTASGPGDVWLFGQYITPSQPYRPWITHFDGQAFTVASTPSFSSGDYAIAGGALLGNMVLAYGSEDTASGLPATKLLAVCPIQVTSASITPSSTRLRPADQTFWSVPTSENVNHDLMSPGLFNTGLIGPGGSFEYTFFAAADYSVRDTTTGSRSTVEVVPGVTPSAGEVDTVFTITAANIEAPVGYKYRVLIKRPHSTHYVLLTTTTQPTVNFIPGTSAGTYSFECELKTPSGVTSPSPAVNVSVS
jgi:hypothetical protein